MFVSSKADEEKNVEVADEGDTHSLLGTHTSS